MQIPARAELCPAVIHTLRGGPDQPEGEDMFTDQLRHAVEASPRCELPRVSAALWKAYAAGQIGEGEAQALSDLIEAKKALPATQKPAQRRVGSRPRSPASMERRRS